MKFNVKDYPGDYVMMVDSYEEACEFVQVLADQGLRWRGKKPYVGSLALPPVRILDCSSGAYWSSVSERVPNVRSGYLFFYWRDFRDDTMPNRPKTKDVWYAYRNYVLDWAMNASPDDSDPPPQPLGFAQWRTREMR